MRQIRIFDTTMRDGEQSPGCSMNPEEKLQAAKQLEKLGVDVIEAGFPISSPEDFQAVQAIARTVKNSAVCGLARCVEADVRRAYEAVKDAAHPRIHVFIATSDIHLEHKRGSFPPRTPPAATMNTWPRCSRRRRSAGPRRSTSRTRWGTASPRRWRRWCAT